MYVFIFLFGTIIGSFLNVIVFRLDSDNSALKGRSACMSCGKKLCWYELIPILSFVFQKGRCRGCDKKISIQYPLVEIMTGLIFLLVSNFQLSIFNFQTIFNVSMLQFLNLIYLWVVFSILIVITVYDIKHKIIPDSLVFLFAGVSFIALVSGISLVEITPLNLLSGPILAVPFALLWLVSKGNWIGFGDAKLALGIGWFMGLIDGASSIILAFWIGAFFGIALILISKTNSLFFKSKNFTIKSEIPFAPFLILGMTLIFFFGWDILSLKLVVGSW